MSRDDYLDRFWLQGSSQWDAYAHFRHPVHGDYNGVDSADIHAGAGGRLGVDAWAAQGIVGRGVLIDLARSFERRSVAYDVASPFSFTVDDLERAAEEQALEFRPGDILILRTGWMRAYQAASPADFIRTNIVCAGLEPSERTAAFLWDQRFAAVAADNCSVESCPSPPGGYQFPLHCILLPLFGMPIGEFWDLEGLAAACAADGCYEFFFASVPLNLRGGIGSPAQALAIR
jgi:kynurenine formamidase